MYVLLSFFSLKHRLERRYTTGMVGVSYGKPLNLFSSHTELGSLVRPIVSAAVHGKTRWRTDFHAMFHGSLDIKMFEFILFSNAQIEISINWCTVHGERTHEPSYS